MIAGIARGKSKAVDTVRGWLGAGAVFLDTETTGLDASAEIIDIAIVDQAGQVLLDTLVKPVGRVPAESSHIHGLSEEDFAGAPSWGEILPLVRAALQGKTVVTYNADFDYRLLVQTSEIFAKSVGGGGISGADSWADKRSWRCAMKTFAAFRGVWNNRHKAYRWCSLAEAVRSSGVAATNNHRALGDAEACRQVVLYLAAQ